MRLKKGEWALQFVVDDINAMFSLTVVRQAKAIVVHGMDLTVS